MNFDLNIDNYSKKDYLDFFSLQNNPSIDQINNKYQNLLNNLNNGDLDNDQKKEMKTFLSQCKNNLINILNKEKEDYKLINSDFISDLDQNETFQNNRNFVIKKQTKEQHQTSKINPIARKCKSLVLNINTLFRKNYYDTKSTDFTIDLPEEFKNVIALRVQTVQIPDSVYTFSSQLGTNEFSIELFDIDPDNVTIKEQQKKVIKIMEGSYTGKQLETYLNTYVFSDISLNRVGCKFDNITNKFRFFRDYREVNKGGLPAASDGTRYAFNIDWRLSADQNRPIQLNMGWLLGYRQRYYNWESDYIDTINVSYDKFEGYNPEGSFYTLNPTYYILSIDDFNKNYANSFKSPFQNSIFNDQNSIAKIPINNLISVDDVSIEAKREYFGPVNIKKLQIKLLDKMGRVVDLNNNDYSFTLKIEQLYDTNVTIV